MKTIELNQGQWVTFCAASLELLRLLGKKHYTLLFNHKQKAVFIYPFNSNSDAHKLLQNCGHEKDVVLEDTELMQTLRKNAECKSAKVLIPPSL